MSDSIATQQFQQSGLAEIQTVKMAEGHDDDKYVMSWRTRRSRSLDNTDRFDIGRYELTSVPSSPGFFTTGVMNASLKPTGKWPAASDRLNNSTTYGAMRSIICFKNSSVLDRQLKTCLAVVARHRPRRQLSVVRMHSFSWLLMHSFSVTSANTAIYRHIYC